MLLFFSHELTSNSSSVERVLLTPLLAARQALAAGRHRHSTLKFLSDEP